MKRAVVQGPVNAHKRGWNLGIDVLRDGTCQLSVEAHDREQALDAGFASTAEATRERATRVARSSGLTDSG
jgi:hypothetical protein